MLLSRIDRTYARIPVTATLADGTPAVLDGVDVAVLPADATPTTGTSWVAANYSAGVATVLLAGPDADPDAAVRVPRCGGNVWIRIVDALEVQAVLVGRVRVS